MSALPAMASVSFLTLMLVLSLVAQAAAAPTARGRFEDATAREVTIRAQVNRVPPAAPTSEIDRVVRPARRVAAEYEALVRRFPTSGYSDNALMQAAGLSQFLYQRYGRAADRVSAEKYYDWLVREYPSSPLRREARVAVRALDSLVADTRGQARAPTPPPATARPDSTSPRATARPDSTAMPVPVPLPAALDRRPRSAPAILRGIDRVVLDSTVRITLALDRETPFSHEVLTSPARAFVDLSGATAVEGLRDHAVRYDSGAVRQVRVGHRPSALRVVLDLDDATPVSIFTLYNPYRIVIDAERAPAATRPRAAIATAAPVAPHVPVTAASPPTPAAPIIAVPVPTPPPVRATDENAIDLTPREGRNGADHASPTLLTAAAVMALAPLKVAVWSSPPTVSTSPGRAAPSHVAGATPPASSTRAGEVVPSRPLDPDRTTPAPMPAVAEPPVPSAPAANADGGFSLARQLGLGISRIVIDAGHGGHDPGTLTTGTSEARLVLDVALRLEKLLVKDGFEVVLTRRTDTFVPLEQRPAIANREGADLFLSIHANASRSTKARGVEVYYLSFASNPEAEAVAARENSTSVGGMHNLPSIVRAIALNNKLDESRDLAAMVQRSLAARLSKSNTALVSRGVKKAPFVVLIGAQMPSILAEIGFVTNRHEAGLIKTPAYRQVIAESLQAAVLQYQRTLKRQSAVATR